MPTRIMHHNVRRHWPKAGIRSSIKKAANGKLHTNPFPGKWAWLAQVRRAIDTDVRGLQILRLKKTWVDLCFTELILAAREMHKRLAETDVYTFIAEVKPHVPWATDLPAHILTELFLTLLVGRAMWKIHPSPPLDPADHCLAAKSLDNFNDSLKAWAAWVEFQVSNSDSGGEDGTVVQGGVEHFRARGLVDPENFLINSQLSDNLDQLSINCMFQQVDRDLTLGIRKMTVSAPTSEENNGTSGKDSGPLVGDRVNTDTGNSQHHEAVDPSLV